VPACIVKVSLNVIATLSAEALVKVPATKNLLLSVCSLRLPTNVLLLVSTVIVSTILAGLCLLEKVFCPCHVPLLNVAGGAGVGVEAGVMIIITGVGVGAGVGVGVGVGIEVGVGIGVATRVLVGVDLATFEKITILATTSKNAITEAKMI